MNMNVSIGRLTMVFIVFFLLVSLVMVNVQVFQAQDLAASPYNPRHCLRSSEPVRGSIYDRHGVLLVRSVPDDKAPCGYRREWNPAAVKAGLAPLIGYFSYRYGAQGVEAHYNDVLSGVGTGTTLQTVSNQLLHKQVVGSDIWLTIDLKLQEQVNELYNTDAEFGGVCQTPGSNPAGSIIVENPQTGEILALLSRPYYDPNRIDDDTYWRQINSDPTSPLIDRAAQGLYIPGSTFKTVTLSAALDSGQLGLDKTYTRDEAYDVVVNGHHFHWDDSFAGAPFPMTVEQGYAYSVNPIFARVAVQIGKDTWLNYLRRFGIATPGTSVPAVPFDGAYSQSRAYPPGVPLDDVTFAASGFGQGDLTISPLTMAEVTSTVAADGQLLVPHVLYKQVPTGQNAADVTPEPSQLYAGTAQPVIRPETAAAMRQAMRSVVTFGTAWQGQSVKIADSPAIEGGKTGTGQQDGYRPQTWWISMAPAVPSVGQLGKLVVVVMKEHSGEGACQIFVGDDIYKCASADRDVDLGDLGPCPAATRP
ncbi:MAG: penicillin-binding transpeptidase domain-containing protein [Ktedonobacterales bacterium]